MKEKRNTILWCHKDGDRYEDFYDHPDVVKFCGHTEGIIKVKVIEKAAGRADDYWAWWDNDDQEFCMVFQHSIVQEVCYPYGSKAEEEAGRGWKLPVEIIEL